MLDEQKRACNFVLEAHDDSLSWKEVKVKESGMKSTVEKSFYTPITKESSIFTQTND
jgi:hypothetical protein